MSSQAAPSVVGERGPRGERGHPGKPGPPGKDAKPPDESTARGAARVASIAVLGWMLQRLLAYAARRYSLIKTLEVDFAYRMADSATGYQRLKQWHKKFEKIAADDAALVAATEFPVLKLRPEKHILYPAVQSEMVDCLWGEEVQKVREAYRYLYLIECRIEVIRRWYEEILEHRNFTTPAKVTTAKWFPQVVEELDCSIKTYHKYLIKLVRKRPLREEWLEILDKPPVDDDWNYGKDTAHVDFLGKVAESLFISRRVAYTTQVIWPILVLVFFAIPFIWWKLPIFWCLGCLVGAVLNAIIWARVFWYFNLKTKLLTIGQESN